MKYKRISDFPKSQAESINVLGVEDGHNVQMEVLSKKATLQNIQKGVANKANKDGNYPKMTAGFAQDIVGDGSATPEEFSFRPTAGEDRNVANTTYYHGERNGAARIEKVKGNSVVWNQKARMVTAGDSNNGITMTVDSNGLLLNGTATSQSVIRIVQYGIFTYKVGHKYILVVDAIDRSANNEVRFSDFNLSNVFGKPSFIYTPSIANVCNIVIVIKSGVTLDNYRISGIISSDLTQMFGAGNEPTTVEEFYERMPKGVNINAYIAGKIVDGNYGGVKTTGFNQLVEKWEVGTINGSTGANSNSPNDIRSLNYIPVLPSTPYYFKSDVLITVVEYDSEKKYIGNIFWGGTTNKVKMTSSNVSYIRVATYGGTYGKVYKNDICINLAWDEYAHMNGMYQPYKPFTHDLSWVNKYFPATINGETQYGMRSAGSERDEIRFNSTTQKWEAVQNVGVRAYAEGDTEDTSVTTDGTNTNYALGTPIITEITEDINMDFDVSDYGTEELIVAEGAQSAPLVADITYAPNALSTIKQVPDILKRLKALESAVAQQTTNVEPSNIEE